MHELCSYDIIKMMSESSAPNFSGKSIAHAQESHSSSPVQLPAPLPNIIPTAMQEPSCPVHNPNCEPVTQSPPGILVCPHTRALNLLLKQMVYTAKK